MSLISRAIGTLYNGVSEQTDIMRSESQLHKQVNMVSSTSKGLSKRQPIEVVGSAGVVELPEHIAVSSIKRTSNDKYQIIVSEGSIKVVDLDTGALMPVTATEGFGYLQGIEKGSDIGITTVEDFSFILNKKATVKSRRMLRSKYKAEIDAIEYEDPLRLGAKFAPVNSSGYPMNGWVHHDNNAFTLKENVSVEYQGSTAPWVKQCLDDLIEKALIYSYEDNPFSEESNKYYFDKYLPIFREEAKRDQFIADLKACRAAGYKLSVSVSSHFPLDHPSLAGDTHYMTAKSNIGIREHCNIYLNNPIPNPLVPVVLLSETAGLFDEPSFPGGAADRTYRADLFLLEWFVYASDRSVTLYDELTGMETTTETVTFPVSITPNAALIYPFACESVFTGDGSKPNALFKRFIVPSTYDSGTNPQGILLGGYLNQRSRTWALRDAGVSLMDNTSNFNDPLNIGFVNVGGGSLYHKNSKVVFSASKLHRYVFTIEQKVAAGFEKPYSISNWFLWNSRFVAMHQCLLDDRVNNTTDYLDKVGYQRDFGSVPLDYYVDTGYWRNSPLWEQVITKISPPTVPMSWSDWGEGTKTYFPEPPSDTSWQGGLGECSVISNRPYRRGNYAEFLTGYGPALGGSSAKAQNYQKCYAIGLDDDGVEIQLGINGIYGKSDDIGDFNLKVISLVQDLSNKSLYSTVSLSDNVHITAISNYELAYNYTSDRFENYAVAEIPIDDSNSGEVIDDITRLFVVIKQGVAEQTYSLSVEGNLVAYTTGTTASPSTWKPRNILNNLSTQLIAKGYSCTIYGDTFMAVSKSDGSDFTFDYTDTWNGQAMYCLKNAVNSESDLPQKFIEGIPIRVGSASSGYYARYVTTTPEVISTGTGIANQLVNNNDTDYPVVLQNQTIVPHGDWTALEGKEAGRWEECSNPREERFIEERTMPHVLIYNDDNTFTFKPIIWGYRAIGDNRSAPMPSFVDKTIQDVFFHRNRLGMLTEESVVMSRDGSFFNFFPASAKQIVATDPIDFQVSHTKVSILKSAVPFNSDLLLFSDNTQFVMSGGDVLSPESVSVKVASEYSNDGELFKPISMGNKLAFPELKSDGLQIHEYVPVSQVQGKYVARNIMAHVPTLVKSNLTFRHCVAASSLTKTLAVSSYYTGDTDNSNIYLYKFEEQSDGQKIQESWSVQVPAGNFIKRILGMEFFEEWLYFTVLTNSDRLHSFRFSLRDSVEEASTYGYDTPYIDYLYDPRTSGFIEDIGDILEQTYNPAPVWPPVYSDPIPDPTAPFILNASSGQYPPSVYIPLGTQDLGYFAIGDSVTKAISVKNNTASTITSITATIVGSEHPSDDITTQVRITPPLTLTTASPGEVGDVLISLWFNSLSDSGTFTVRLAGISGGSTITLGDFVFRYGVTEDGSAPVPPEVVLENPITVPENLIDTYTNNKGRLTVYAPSVTTDSRYQYLQFVDNIYGRVLDETGALIDSDQAREFLPEGSLIGITYKSEIVTSKFILLDKNNIPVNLDNKLQIKRTSLNVRNCKFYQATVMRERALSSDDVVNVIRLDVDPDDYKLAYSKSLSCQSDSMKMRVKLESDDPRGLTLVSVKWEGSYFSRSKAM